MADAPPPLLNIAAVSALVARIRPVNRDAEALIEDALAQERVCIVSFLNAHAVNLACRHRAFFEALRTAELLLRDGAGVKILMKTLRRAPGENMVGTDFIPKVLSMIGSRSAALYGSSAEAAQAAAQALQRQGAQAVTHDHGFHPIAHYVERVRSERPRIVVLGMGMPKQELVADAIRAQCAGPLLILNGGAILDYMAGRFARAPSGMRRLGLEWLFRLYLEPRRMWRRYLLGNAVFLLRTALAGAQCRLSRASEPLSGRDAGAA